MNEKYNWTAADGTRYTETPEATYFEDGIVLKKPHGCAWFQMISNGEHEIDYSLPENRPKENGEKRR